MKPPTFITTLVLAFAIGIEGHVLRQTLAGDVDSKSLNSEGAPYRVVAAIDSQAATSPGPPVVASDTTDVHDTPLLAKLGGPQTPSARTEIMTPDQNAISTTFPNGDENKTLQQEHSAVQSGPFEKRAGPDHPPNFWANPSFANPIFVWCRYIEEAAFTGKPGRTQTPRDPFTGQTFELYDLCHNCKCVIGPWAADTFALVCMGLKLQFLLDDNPEDEWEEAPTEYGPDDYTDHSFLCRRYAGCMCIYLPGNNNEDDFIKQVNEEYSELYNIHQAKYPEYASNWEGGVKGHNGPGQNVGGNNAYHYSYDLDTNIFNDKFETLGMPDIGKMNYVSLRSLLDLRPAGDGRRLLANRGLPSAENLAHSKRSADMEQDEDLNDAASFKSPDEKLVPDASSPTQTAQVVRTLAPAHDTATENYSPS